MSGTWYDPIIISDDSGPVPDDRLRRSSAFRGGATVTNHLRLDVQTYDDHTWKFYFDIGLTVGGDFQQRLLYSCYLVSLLIVAVCFGTY